MIEQLRKMVTHGMVALGIVAIALFSGCQTGSKYGNLPTEAGNIFHIGDGVAVMAVLPSGDKLPDHTERIGEDGMITLLYVGPVMAAGKTASELQRDIHKLYVPKYFQELTVTVQGDLRYFYVDGEVRTPGQKDYPGQMTVVKAISVAGGFTDFAKKTKVRLTHGGHVQTVNVTKAIRDPNLDLPVFPGDKIYVPRRILW
jgi:polysaccharide export outer membrane protein